MSPASPYSVAVVLAGTDRSALLTLVSALHRRGVDVLDAELSRPSVDRRVFIATFLATAQRAETVACTLRNVIGVVSVQLCEATTVGSRASRNDDLKVSASGRPGRCDVRYLHQRAVRS